MSKAEFAFGPVLFGSIATIILVAAGTARAERYRPASLRAFVDVIQKR